MRQSDLPQWRRVRSRAELGQRVGGQGHDWPDTAILRANGLQIGTSSSYEALFRMLTALEAPDSGSVKLGETVQLAVLPAGRKVLRQAPGPFAGVLPQALASLDSATLERLDPSHEGRQETVRARFVSPHQSAP